MPRFKPPYPRVQWWHPVTCGLEHLYACSPIGGGGPVGSTAMRDLAGRYDLAHNAASNPPWAIGLPGAYYDVSLGVINQSVPYIPPPFSLLGVFLSTNTGTEQAIYSHDGAGGNDGYRMQMGTTLRLTFGGVSDYTGVSVSQDVWYVALITCTANLGTQIIYARPLHGGASLQASSAVGTVSGTPTAIGVGTRGAFNTQVWAGGIALAAHWSRVLESGEALALLMNPWALIAAPKTQIQALQAASGGGGTIPVFMHHYQQQGMA